MHTSTHSRLLSNYKHRDRQTRSLCVSSSLGRNCRPTDPFSCVVRKLQCCRVARHPLNEFQMPVAQNWGNDCEVFQSFNPSCQSFDTGSQRTQNTAHSTRHCKKLCSRKRKLVKFGYFVWKYLILFDFNIEHLNTSFRWNLNNKLYETVQSEIMVNTHSRKRVMYWRLQRDHLGRKVPYRSWGDMTNGRFPTGSQSFPFPSCWIPKLWNWAQHAERAIRVSVEHFIMNT